MTDTSQQPPAVLAVHSRQLTPQTIALLAQHGYGVPADLDRWIVLVRSEQATGDGRQATDETPEPAAQEAGGGDQAPP